MGARCALISTMPSTTASPPPPTQIEMLVRGVLKVRARVKRVVSFERHPALLAGSRNRTYPGNRYRIESLGPDHAPREASVPGEKSRPGGGTGRET